MASNPYRRAKDIVTDTTTEYLLLPDMEYVFTLSGDGLWKVWDGTTWKTYSESSGSSQAFRAYPPPTGRVQLTVTSGTVTATFRMINPGGKTTLGT